MRNAKLPHKELSSEHGGSLGCSSRQVAEVWQTSLAPVTNPSTPGKFFTSTPQPQLILRRSNPTTLLASFQSIFTVLSGVIRSTSVSLAP
ncbi:PHD and RING finger domain-containing protein [Fusarium oxysporum f. sp. albedinis]|nr:PHD and RING finger domain-containing protein [Fusarium oxysporum f. sp. albedinis]